MIRTLLRPATSVTCRASAQLAPLQLLPATAGVRYASKKAGGSSNNRMGNRPGRRLGIKVHDGQWCSRSSIIYRQRGQTFRPGDGVFMSRDFTLHAGVDGFVKFTRQRELTTHLTKPKSVLRRYVSVVPGPPRTPKEKRKRARRLAKSKLTKEHSPNKGFELITSPQLNNAEV